MTPTTTSPTTTDDDVFLGDGLLAASDASIAVQHPDLVALVFLVWVGAGLAAASRLARRGHTFRPLGALGVLIGPFLMAYSRAARVETRSEPEVVLHLPARHGGATRAVIALLGRPEAVADAAGILRFVGHDLDSVDIVIPVRAECLDDPEDPEHAEARRRLEDAAPFLHDVTPGLRLIPGRGLDAVNAHTSQEPADLVLVAGAPNAQAELCRRGGARTVTVAMLDASVVAR